MAEVRRAAVAGLFYPAEPARLRAQIERCLASAGTDPTASAPKLLIVPHAGYSYSGSVAAHAYALLARRSLPVTRVVLLGPAHRIAPRGLAAPEADAFETPFGRVDIDADALAAVADLPQVVRDDRPHADEHALEVQLPFLQCVLGTFSLAPFVVGDVDAAQVAQVLDRLWGGAETLIVISSDLSHYLPYAQAQAVDRATVQRIVALAEDIEPHEACGAAPLNGALRAARRRALVPCVLDLRNSGDTEGDHRRVVGYAAIAFDEAPS
jgi:AmmeMemoRadiSam system protein B